MHLVVNDTVASIKSLEKSKMVKQKWESREREKEEEINEKKLLQNTDA